MFQVPDAMSHHVPEKQNQVTTMIIYLQRDWEITSRLFTWWRRSASDENKPIIWGWKFPLFALDRSSESARQAPTFTGGGLLTKDSNRQILFYSWLDKYLKKKREVCIHIHGNCGDSSR